jgi:hypothetical protein
LSQDARGPSPPSARRQSWGSGPGTRVSTGPPSTVCPPPYSPACHPTPGRTRGRTRPLAPPVHGCPARAATCSLRDRRGPHHLFPALRGLWNYAHARTELQTAQALGEQLLTLAQQGHDPAMRMAAHMALGTTLFMRGAVAAAHTHFVQAIALYDAHPHQAAAFLYGEDVGVTSRSRDSWTLWYLGYPDQALAQSQAAVTLAQQLAHPLSLSFALGEAAVCHQFRREGHAAQAHAAAALHLATEQGFPHWRAYGTMSKPKSVSSTPSVSPKASTPNPWNSALLPASPACGSSKASGPRPASC